MHKVVKGLLIVLAGGALLLAAVAFALQQWLRSDDFRLRAEREASLALGVPLKLGRLSVDLWPLPAIAADQVRVQTQPPLTLERIEARPQWVGLLAGRLEVATLVVRKAVLPQAGIGALGAALQKKGRVAGAPRAQPAAAAPAMALPRNVALDDITWVDPKGQRLTMDARLALGSDGLLDEATVKILRGRFAGAHGKVERAADHWPVRVEIGGGRITGRLQLRAARPGASQLLQGSLKTENVQIAALTAPSKPLTGRLQAQTSLRAEYRDLAQLLEALQTDTRFTVQDALLFGVDLSKAVETVGLSRGGSTRLETLAGQVTTRGKAVQLSNLVATSGVLSASGNVAIAPNRALSGRLVVDLTRTPGLGVPLSVGGTLDDPSVFLTRGALAGAAIGTLLAPGLGTAAGASAGDAIGEKLRGLFGGK